MRCLLTASHFHGGRSGTLSIPGPAAILFVTTGGVERYALWRKPCWQGATLIATGAALPPPAMDNHRIAVQRFGNDAPWYERRIPFFESADPGIDAVHYYRWALFRAHQRDLGEEGFISTEFLDDVDWQRHPYASLNDATGFHLAEGRWPAVRTGKVCLLLTQPSGKATRIVEFKPFPD